MSQQNVAIVRTLYAAGERGYVLPARRPDADGVDRKPIVDAAVPGGLSGLLHPRRGAGGVGNVLLGVQTELAPTLVETSLRELVFIDHSWLVNGLVDSRGRSQHMSVLVNHA
jgi:hypothetical protein